MTCQTPSISVRSPLNRRQFLRGLGVAMALPMLDVMHPALARDIDDGTTSTADAGSLQ